MLDPMIAGPEGGRHPICNRARVIPACRLRASCVGGGPYETYPFYRFGVHEERISAAAAEGRRSWRGGIPCEIAYNFGATANYATASGSREAAGASLRGRTVRV
jgi:hypothetical protein